VSDLYGWSPDDAHERLARESELRRVEVGS